MTVNAFAKLREISKGSRDNPTESLMSSLPKAVHEFEVFHNRILVATYVRPEQTKGGVFLPDRSLAEDRFQGKIGLVIKLGPLAFKDDAIAKFGGIEVNVGDWVIYRPADGWEMFFVDENGRDGTPCRLIEDSHIFGRTPDPALVY